MKITASNIVRAIKRLPTDVWFDYISERTETKVKFVSAMAAEGPIVIDRRTIKWGFEEVDEETRAEMVESLAAIILAAHTEKGTQ